MDIAEVTINDLVLDSTDEDSPSAAVVFINGDVGYAFFVGSSGRVGYHKTTNGGASWGTGVALTAQTDCFSIAVWYDQWTPGDSSGTYIHIVFAETGTDSVFYERLNTSDDSQLGEIDITGDMGIYNTGYLNPYITKSTDGNLFMAAGASSTLDIWKSTDSGATWN